MKNYLWRYIITLLALLLVTSFTFQVQAHEPQVVDVQVKRKADSGTFQVGHQTIGEDLVQVIFNRVDEKDRAAANKWILLVFPGVTNEQPIGGKPILNLNEVLEKPGTPPKYNPEWKNPGPTWRGFTDQTSILIPPGKSGEIRMFIDFLQAENGGVAPRLFGKAYYLTDAELKLMHSTAKYLALMVHDRAPDASVLIELYYRLDARKLSWKAGDFKAIFGNPHSWDQKNEMPFPATGDYDKNAGNIPVVLKDYRSNLKLPGDFFDDGGKLFEQTLEDIYHLGSGQAGDQVCHSEDLRVPFRKEIVAAKRASYSHVLSGRFSSKWASDSSLHPGFGWRVEAWTNESGSWKKLASDWVSSSGNWELQVPSASGYEGSHLRVLYRAYNSYYEPKDQDGDLYSWKDPDRYNIGSTFYAGHRYADTDGGSANGLGDLYDAAYKMWSRLYWTAGVNPVMSSPIDFWYPNTWYNCGGGSPWSCADTSGNIWLIPAHGTQAPVVSHELAHQLNNKFWDNKRPANSGGSHNLSSCYPTRLGMTLREGFANFIPAWVGYQARNVAEAGFNATQWNLAYDAETRNTPPNCANGWEAEVWVARTFWDLHDTRSDGDDILWFTHKGAVISLYLNNGIANSGDARDMRYYENIYRNAASLGHEDFISDIFEQNKH